MCHSFFCEAQNSFQRHFFALVDLFILCQKLLSERRFFDWDGFARFDGSAHPKDSPNSLPWMGGISIHSWE